MVNYIKVLILIYIDKICYYSRRQKFGDIYKIQFFGQIWVITSDTQAIKVN